MGRVQRRKWATWAGSSVLGGLIVGLQLLLFFSLDGRPPPLAEPDARNAEPPPIYFYLPPAELKPAPKANAAAPKAPPPAPLPPLKPRYAAPGAPNAVALPSAAPQPGAAGRGIVYSDGREVEDRSRRALRMLTACLHEGGPKLTPAERAECEGILFKGQRQLAEERAKHPGPDKDYNPLLDDPEWRRDDAHWTTSMPICDAQRQYGVPCADQTQHDWHYKYHRNPGDRPATAPPQ